MVEQEQVAEQSTQQPLVDESHAPAAAQSPTGNHAPAADAAARRMAGAQKHKPTSSHDGGFTGFGAEFNPNAYTDHNENHQILDPEVKRLGAQHVRVFVPFEVIRSNLLGQVGPDYDQLAVEKDPNNAEKKMQAHRDQVRVNSFLKTLELAGKDTTINLTFNGGTGAPARVDTLSRVVKLLVGQGYSKLQVTLENEPNGPGHAFPDALKQGKAEAGKAAQDYVDEYARLSDDLTAEKIRDNVAIVAGDAVPNVRDQFMQEIKAHGIDKYADAYSFHIYWGANKSFKQALGDLDEIAKKWGKGKPLQVTEFGRERYATKQERANDPDHKGVHAVEKGTESAFEQGLFAVHGINDGFVGMVKWDAFYAGEHHKGDGKGDYGQYSMIGAEPQIGSGAPKDKYKTDESYQLMRMLTHATQPGWRAQGTNHEDQGSECTFRSPDGKDGALIAMSRTKRAITAKDLPKGKKLFVTVWNGDGKGGLSTHTVGPGAEPTVEIPALGAVAISTVGI